MIYSVIEIAHSVQANDHMLVECHVVSNDEHSNQDEECNAMECKVVHMVEACVGAYKLLDFIIREGS